MPETQATELPMARAQDAVGVWRVLTDLTRGTTMADGIEDRRTAKMYGEDVVEILDGGKGLDVDNDSITLVVLTHTLRSQSPPKASTHPSPQFSAKLRSRGNAC